MCIRDSDEAALGTASLAIWAVTLVVSVKYLMFVMKASNEGCLLYTSDAADERSSVDLGGRRIIKKKNKVMVDGLRDRELKT